MLALPMNNLICSILFMAFLAPSLYSRDTLPTACPQCHGTLISVPVVIGGPPSRESAAREARGEALLGGCVGHDHQAVVCLKCRRYLEEDAKIWRPLPTNFGTDKKSTKTSPK